MPRSRKRPAEVDTAAVGQLDVDDGHVGRSPLSPSHRLVDRSGLGDDRDVRLVVQHLAQASAHYFVIVH